MIVDENNEPCSAKDLANEVLLRCLGNISSYLRENVLTLDKMSAKEQDAFNTQLVKQAKRCFKLLGVHEDDIGEMYDPDIPWNNNMTDKELNLVDENGKVIPDMSKVPTSVDTMEERREQEIKERNDHG